MNVCSSCEKSVTDGDSLECVWCGRLQHRSCIKISDDQYCILANFPTNIVYFCMPCFHKLPGALASCDIVDEINSATNVSLKSFECSLTDRYNNLSNQVEEIATSSQLDTIESQLKDSKVSFSDLCAKVDTLAKDITSNCSQLVTMKSQLDDLHKEQSNMDLEEGDPTGSLTGESVTTITVGVVDEQRERDRRRLNLIFHNVPESAKQSGPERKADDVNMINGLLHQHLGYSPTVSNALHLGKKADRPRLLKLTVTTIQEKSNILRNCYKLRNSKTLRMFKRFLPHQT